MNICSPKCLICFDKTDLFVMDFINIKIKVSNIAGSGFVYLSNWAEVFVKRLHE